MKRLSSYIVNLSNTCYISCSLQLLLRYRPFTDFISFSQKKYYDIPIFQILENYTRIFLDKNEPLNPKELVDYMKIDCFKQQDIVEFLTQLISEISEKLDENDLKEFQSMIMCTMVTDDNKNRDQFFFFTLPVEEDKDISEILMDNIESNKQIFSSYPKMLMIQLQRMSYDKELGRPIKNNKPVLFPDTIDLTRFNGGKYKIYSIINHIGSGLGGHYKSFLRDDESWIHTSDSKVDLVDESFVLSELKSELFPSYLYIYVTNRDDIHILRGLYEDNEPFEISIISDDDYTECYWSTPEFRQLKTDDRLVLAIQEFDIIKFKFHPPVIKKFSNRHDLENDLEEYHASYNVQYACYEQNISYKLLSSIPEGYYVMKYPLYCLIQPKGHRIVDTNILFVGKPITVIINEVPSGFNFPVYFTSAHIFGDIISFLKLFWSEYIQSDSTIYICGKVINKYYDIENYEDDYISTSANEDKLNIYISTVVKPDVLSIFIYYTPANKVNVTNIPFPRSNDDLIDILKKHIKDEDEGSYFLQINHLCKRVAKKDLFEKITTSTTRNVIYFYYNPPKKYATFIPIIKKVIRNRFVFSYDFDTREEMIESLCEHFPTIKDVSTRFIDIKTGSELIYGSPKGVPVEEGYFELTYSI